MKASLAGWATLTLAVAFSSGCKTPNGGFTWNPWAKQPAASSWNTQPSAVAQKNLVKPSQAANGALPPPYTGQQANAGVKGSSTGAPAASGYNLRPNEYASAGKGSVPGYGEIGSQSQAGASGSSIASGAANPAAGAKSPAGYSAESATGSRYAGASASYDRAAGNSGSNNASRQATADFDSATARTGERGTYGASSTERGDRYGRAADPKGREEFESAGTDKYGATSGPAPRERYGRDSNVADRDAPTDSPSAEIYGDDSRPSQRYNPSGSRSLESDRMADSRSTGSTRYDNRRNTASSEVDEPRVGVANNYEEDDRAPPPNRFARGRARDDEDSRDSAVSSRDRYRGSSRSGDVDELDELDSEQAERPEASLARRKAGAYRPGRTGDYARSRNSSSKGRDADLERESDPREDPFPEDLEAPVRR